MKFVWGARAFILPVLVVRGDAGLREESPPGPSSEFEDDANPLVPLPPAPGSDAVLPAAYWRHYRRQERREENLRLASSPPTLRLRHPDEGPFQSLVLLLRFSDHAVEDLPTKEEIATLFNDNIGVDPAKPLVKEADNEVNPTGSVKEVYQLNSHGALHFHATVTDWISLAHDEAYYASDADGAGQSGLSKSRFRDAIREALEELAADPAPYTAAGFDIDSFDYTDGQLDGFGVLHSGHGAEYGGPQQATRIWSHKSSGIKWPVPVPVAGGHAEARKVNKFFVSSAFHGHEGGRFMRMGVLCHEIGHSLGLPDLYDISLKGKGLGNYDFMANGNYGFDNTGFFPTNLSAWSKVALGWAVPTLIEADGTYILEAASSDHQVYKITHGFPEGDKPEYLLLENRQPVGYDSTMRDGGGIAIYHVDESVRKQNTCGYPDMPDAEEFPENKRHYRVALLASDGAYGLEKGETVGAGGDLLWHAGSILQELGTGADGVFPNTESYQEGDVEVTGVRIYGFSASGMSMTFSVEGFGDTRESTQLRGPTVARAVD